jgi:hypothetical protein
MHVVRADHAPRYEAPGHFLMYMRRLQGKEAGPADGVWVGLSEIEPGGGTVSAASDCEKFYVVVEGVLEIESTLGDSRSSAILRPLDSCRIAAGETRRLSNRSDGICKVLLVMGLPREQR